MVQDNYYKYEAKDFFIEVGSANSNSPTLAPSLQADIHRVIVVFDGGMPVRSILGV